jgi:hypothetical protein
MMLFDDGHEDPETAALAISMVSGGATEGEPADASARLAGAGNGKADARTSAPESSASAIQSAAARGGWVIAAAVRRRVRPE